MLIGFAKTNAQGNIRSSRPSSSISSCSCRFVVTMVDPSVHEQHRYRNLRMNKFQSLTGKETFISVVVGTVNTMSVLYTLLSTS